MKISFVMFFLIVFCIYAIGNVYMFVRGWQALEIMGHQRLWFAAVFWIAALSFIVTQILRVKGVSGAFSDIFHVIGSFWVAIMLYGFLALVVIDILRIIGWVAHIKPDFIYHPLNKALILGVVFLIIAVILGFGYRNVHRLQATHLEIPIDKTAGCLNKLRIVMASDVHLGYVNSRKSLARLVNAINDRQPDVVLLAGDTFDGTPEMVIREDAGVEFDRLQSRYGAYAISGNHEYIGEREKPDAVNTIFGYMASHGVQPLRDSVALIDGSFYIAGRNDRMAGTRKTIPELLEGVDRQLPVILLDHQPYHLEQAEQAGVDLQLSGHTHHGQMWPLNYITQKIYEKDWGFLQKGKSNFYVSCGAGVWGPPVRTAGYSEIVVIDLKFNH